MLYLGHSGLTMSTVGTQVFLDGNLHLHKADMSNVWILAYKKQNFDNKYFITAFVVCLNS